MEKKLCRLPLAKSASQPSNRPTASSFPQQPCEPSRGRAKRSVHAPNFRGNHGNGVSYQRKSQKSHETRSYEVSNSEAVAHNGKNSKHGMRADHLLNFSYAPLSSQEPGGATHPGRRGYRSRQTVLTKPQFLQANCQFVVKESTGDAAEYLDHLTDPDKMVDWSSIEQVRLISDQLTACPICIDVPVAAKITKCAHVYCWPCILHSLSYSERSWAKCPICFEPVSEADLKSVSNLVMPQFTVGQEITLLLMRRDRESMYIRPRDSWQSSGCGNVFSLQDSPDDIKYSKIISASTDDLLQVLDREQRQLTALLQQDDTQSLEASFIEAALNSLGERRNSLNNSASKHVIPPRSGVTTPADTVTLANTVASVPHPNLQAISYKDAFDDEVDTCDDEGQGHVAVSVQQSDDTDEPGRLRSTNSTSSCDSGEADCAVATGLTLPATGTQPGPSQGSKRTEVYYFYQAADGQNVYLHSVNTRVIAAQYGSLAFAPPVLTATIVEIESNSMTMDLRKRLKYLRHLPLHSQFAVCEVNLRPPVVSTAVLRLFEEELTRRKKARNRRQRAESRHQNKAATNMQRQMGRFPDMRIPLDSNSHFPASADSVEIAAAVALPDEAQHIASSVVAASQPSRADASPPAEARTGLSTTPVSFAQAMKGSQSAAPPWPRVQTGATYVRASAKPPQSNGSIADGDEASAAPAYKESFSADFGQIFNQLTVKEEPSSTAGSKGKKKKAKKQKVLFSTSVHRPNL